ncbi:family 16 glycosylhydrolase [Rubellimicrobium roseum]|uniref:Glycosyl hydrolase family protein n=1 Tax=Rubellimicrobium roseum TaxID=687525 RepID=A0A5C4NJW7_9RHOB|nr:family 16 glycosylhydrolase [Rubellimicrobium roseum]TNC74893.1 glycosyl hydrolase family protein [Rubellimicrobium roseum]
MSTTEGTWSIDLVQIGEPATTESWLVSDWAAGQSAIMEWSPDNVVAQADGSVQFALSAAPAGSSHAYCGGEVQSCEAASTGTWTWTAQAPVMQDGAVFGMFTYRADHFNDPWIEFDFEFVGSDTTQVRLNIHMETATGEHVTLEQGNNWQPVIVDLGFDAALGFHTYEITVTETEAIFLVDGQVVGRFGAADMPHGTWTTGDMNGFANLWCVDPSLEGWAGDWAYAGTPLTATMAAIDVRPGDLGGFGPVVIDPTINGDAGDDVLIGTDGDDTLDGQAGNDMLAGDLGNDALLGGEGDDTLKLDAGNDLLDGGSGRDWILVGGSEAASIDLSLTTVQNTGSGMDTLLSIENALGGSGADMLSGSESANILLGDGGSDTLLGGGGDDNLSGGAGADDMDGGAGNDQVLGDDGDDTLRLDAGDDTLDGGAGMDWMAVTGSTAAVIDLARTGGQATGYGTDTLLDLENVSGGAGADRLYGDAADNILKGNGGGDLLHGRAGADTLIAGTGKDTIHGGVDDVRDAFVFTAITDSVVGNNRDVVHDFRSGLDDLDLSGIDGRTTLAGDQAFGFGGTKASAYSVWYAAGRSEVIVRADVSGDRTADVEIRVVGVTSLAVNDLVL